MTYDQPATRWTEALPIGNGRLGAMVFGGTEDERLQVNEGTLWGGRPHDYTNPDAFSRLDEIRRLIFAGNVAEAEKLADAVMGRPKLLMPYQPFCDVRMHFPGHGQATAYRRELRLDDATVETRYTVGATEFRREVFASFPAQVLVVRLTASTARTADVQCRDRFSATGNTRREHGSRHAPADRPDPAPPESRSILDWFLGRARPAVRGRAAGADRGRLGARGREHVWQSPAPTR